MNFGFFSQSFKLSPLIVFLLLLFLLMCSLIFSNIVFYNTTYSLETFFETDIVKEGYVNKEIVNSYIQKTYGGKVYDNNGNIVDYIDISQTYYDKNRNRVYYYVPSDIGVTYPSLVDLVDLSGNAPPTSADIIRFNNFIKTGNWDISYNIADFVDLSGNTYEDIMFLISFFNNNTDNKDISDNNTLCNLDYENMSLDDYISNYYKFFWDKNRQMYTDDYILKTQIVPMSCPTCPLGSTRCTCSKSTTPTTTKPVPLTNPLTNPLLQVVPTPLTGTNPTPINKRSVAGNYNGDNTSSNTGYMSGISLLQNSNNSLATVENNFNSIPSKGDNNFQPILSDFSKFGR